MLRLSTQEPISILRTEFATEQSVNVSEYPEREMTISIHFVDALKL
jgi:hypothetical protein